MSAPLDEAMFLLSFEAADEPFTIDFTAQGDALLVLSDPMGTDQAPAHSPAHLALTSETGTYEVLVLSPTAQTQTYGITLTL